MSTPKWQHLPLQFKERVVGKLDFKSRYHLQRCSKADKSLIDNCPINLTSFLIITTFQGFQLTIDGFSKFIPTLNFSEISDALWSIFKNAQNSFCQKLSISDDFNHRFDDIFDKIILNLKKKSKNLIKVRELDVRFLKINDFLDFFELIDPGFLKSLKISNDFDFSKEQKDKLIGMEQFKSLKSFSSLIPRLESFETEDFFHLNDFMIRFPKAEEQDIRKLIEFSQSPQSSLTKFHVAVQKLSITNIGAVLGNEDDGKFYLQQYPIAHDNSQTLSLIVKFECPLFESDALISAVIGVITDKDLDDEVFCDNQYWDRLFGMY